MANIRCPGQDRQYWKPEDVYDIKCPYCEHDMEFFKDEPMLKCRSCGQEVRNPKINLSCAKWCKFAKDCIGDLPGEGAATAVMYDKLIAEIRRYFGNDKSRIEHAIKVLSYANKINNIENGDQLVVKAAAVLHDIGIPESERKYNSTAYKYQEIEGPPVAEKIMKDLNIADEIIDHVCRIIANHHSGKNIDTKEFRVIWDADKLANFKRGETAPAKSKEELNDYIDNTFKTAAGKRIAVKEFTEKAE